MPDDESTQARRLLDLDTMDGKAWWEKYDPERTDSDWGRMCFRCGRAVPSGARYWHRCAAKEAPDQTPGTSLEGTIVGAAAAALIERDRLRTELAEARATIAAEQGKPEGALSEDWVYSCEWDDDGSGGYWVERWANETAGLVVWRGPTASGNPTRMVWYWAPEGKVGTECPTARAAMRAAKEAPDGD